MFFDNFLFINISFFCLLCFFSVIFSYFILFFNNPIFSILYLMLIFLFSSFIFLQFNLNFLALIILVIYLGALVVLFLFIVMMLNIKFLELNRTINFFPFLIIFFCLIFLINPYYFFNNNDCFYVFYIFSNDWSKFFFNINIFYLFSNFLYTYNFINLIIISIILFCAMLGSIIITLTSNKFSKKQNSNLQVLRINNLNFIK